MDTDVDGDIDHLCQGLFNTCLSKASHALQYFVCFNCKNECFEICRGEKKHKVEDNMSKKDHTIREMDIGGKKDETDSNIPMRFYAHQKRKEH